MRPIDLCIEQDIEVYTIEGIKTVPGLRYEQFAVNKLLDEETGGDGNPYTITRLATGGSLMAHNGCFYDPESACAAMVEVQALRNDWSDLKYSDSDKKYLASKIQEICTKHGGFSERGHPMTDEIVRLNNIKEPV